MKQVWIVIKYYYERSFGDQPPTEEQSIEKVFLKKEDAEAWVEERKTRQRGWFSIEAFDVE